MSVFHRLEPKLRFKLVETRSMGRFPAYSHLGVPTFRDSFRQSLSSVPSPDTRDLFVVSRTTNQIRVPCTQWRGRVGTVGWVGRRVGSYGVIRWVYGGPCQPSTD